MAWTDIAAGDVDIDSPIDTDLCAAIKGNLEALRMVIFGPSVEATSGTTATWSTKASVKVYVPSLATYTGIARQLTATIEGKVSAGGTAYYRLQDKASSVTGTASDGTTSTSYVPVTLQLDIDDSWVGTVRTINLQMDMDDVSGATGYLRCVNSVTWRMVY